jgi:LCP family protein required for cell wall assembly
MTSAPAAGRHRIAARYARVRAGVRIGAKVVAALVSFTVLLASGWGWYNYAALKQHTHHVPIRGLAPTKGRSGVHGQAENILIVGIDSRAGLSAQERRKLQLGNDTTDATDTIMLVHVPADGSKATLMSIPRDSWVHIKGYQDAKINAAYADGYYHSGATTPDSRETAAIDTLLATVKQLTGVPINHYVQVGFAGFEEIVKAIGTIPINLCQSVDDTHAYNVAHGETGGSGFVMSAGHHNLTPPQALAFVRQRHNIPGPVSDDLGRELRQRYFLSAAFHQILTSGTLLNPFRLHDLVNAVDDAFTFDPHFDTLQFADQMINLTSGNIVGASIPTEGSIPGEGALRVDPTQVRRAVRAAFYGAPHKRGSPKRTAHPHLQAPAKQRCVY